MDQRYRAFVAELASDADTISAAVCYTLNFLLSPSGLDNDPRTLP